MGKRTNTAAQAGKAKVTPEAKPWVTVDPKPVVEEDGDSDNGSFLDDDTEDFLPAAWKSGTGPKNQNKSDNISAKSKLSTATLPSETPSLSQKVQDVASKTMTTQTTTTEVSIIPEATILEETVTISRLRVPISMVRKSNEPKSEVEELQAKIRTLTFELDKKDRDLKSAKNEAGMARTKQLVGDQSRLEELRKLEVQLKAKHEAERKAFQEELRNVGLDRQKATADLRKLRVSHEALKQKHIAAVNCLNKATASSAGLAQQVEHLTSKSSVSEGTIIRLRSDLAATNADKQNLRSQLTREQNKERTLRTQYNDLVTNYNDAWSTSSRSLTTYFDGILHNPGRSDADYRDLQSQYDEVAEKLEHEKREVIRIEAKSSSLVDQLGEARREASKYKGALLKEKIKSDNGKYRISELETRIVELETDRDSKAPLIKVAANIRLRYLENAREVAEGISRAEVDRAILMDGNNAAHRANGAVDAALFKLGLVPEGYLEDATHVFQTLYDVMPENYGCWSPTVLRLMDCRATLQSLKPADGIKSHEERDRHDELDRQILELHDELSTSDFEVDDRVKFALSEMEELNDEIVETDRSRHRRRRRNVRGTYNDTVEDEMWGWG